MWGPLLAAGVEIFEYRPTMFHVKVMVVDGYLVSVGSTNFDDRSFHLNDESNLNIYDHAFAADQIARLRGRPREITPCHVRGVEAPAAVARRSPSASRGGCTRSSDQRTVSGNGTGWSAGEFSSPSDSSIATVT